MGERDREEGKSIYFLSSFLKFFKARKKLMAKDGYVA